MEDLIDMSQDLRADMLELSEQMETAPLPDSEERYQELRASVQFVSWVLSRARQESPEVSRLLFRQLQKLTKAQQRMGRARRRSSKSG